MDAAELAAKQRSTRAIRGVLTRAIAALVASTTFAEGCHTEKAREEVVLKLEKVRSYANTCERNYNAILEAVETDDLVRHYTDRVNTVYTDTERVILRAIDAINRIDEALQVAPAPQPTQAVQRGGFKVQSALEPAKLTSEATPAELESWLRGFRAYHTASNMDTLTRPEQQAFLLKCVDVDIEAEIRQRAGENSPIFPTANPDDMNCIGVIQEHFYERYPLVSRRLDFFSLTQQTGQSFKAFATELRRRGHQADLANLEVDDMYVFRMMAGCTDKELRDLLFRIEEPTMAKILKEATAYEVGKRAMAACDAPTQAVQATAAAVTQGQSQQGPRFRQQQKSSTCFRCGDAQHQDRKKCRATNLTCNECGKTGHIAKGRDGQIVCMTLKRKTQGESAKQATGTIPKTQETHERRDDDDGDKAARVFLCKHEEYTCSVGTHTRSTPRLQVNVRQGDKEFSFRATPDTGATRAVISKAVVDRNNLVVREESIVLRLSLIHI